MSIPTLAALAARRFREKLAIACPEHVLDVRVFGSMARGDFHETSDLDVFVLVDRHELPLSDIIATAAWQTQYEMDLPFSLSPLIMSREHFEELRRRERRIALDIVSEGVPV